MSANLLKTFDVWFVNMYFGDSYSIELDTYKSSMRNQPADHLTPFPMDPYLRGSGRSDCGDDVVSANKRDERRPDVEVKG